MMHSQIDNDLLETSAIENTIAEADRNILRLCHRLIRQLYCFWTHFGGDATRSACLWWLLLRDVYQKTTDVKFT